MKRFQLSTFTFVIIAMVFILTTAVVPAVVVSAQGTLASKGAKKPPLNPAIIGAHNSSAASTTACNDSRFHDSQ